MNFLADLIPTLTILGILILVHELGHFIACRLSRVRVEKFSIGFGPEIFHVQGKETRYTLSLLPFGGYVKPSGESVGEIGAGGPQPYDYLGASVSKRILIVIAGVLMNYVLGFVLFLTVFLAGRPVTLAQIGGFVPGYPAISSGLAQGDRILAIEGNPVTTWGELTQHLSRVPGPEVRLDIQRRNRMERFQVAVRVEEVRDVFGETHRLPRLGILPDPEAYAMERLSFLPALREAFLTEFYLTGMTYKALYYLLTGRLSLRTVSGPIGIMAMTGTAAKMGLVYLLHLTAMLSVSLAVINLLPIPALDGGHLVFLLIEAVQRRKVSLKFQEKATQVGFFLLMILMVLVLYNDLVNLQVVDRVKQTLSR